MENIVRTVYSAYLQSVLLLRLPFVAKPSTTLNEKFNIQSGILPTATEYPAMRYYAIGNGGHKMSVGAGGIPKPEVVQHEATDAALYNHLPFVLREDNNDLDVVARAKYGLRRIEIHDGKSYVAYYLKRMDLASTVAGMEYITVTQGTSTVAPFTPDSSNLNPNPSPLSPTGVNIISGDYVSATAKIGLVLTVDDVAELLNVSKIIYNDDSYAIISEIALCSGVDKNVLSPAIGNATINFNEVIAVQIVSHVNAFFPLKYSNNGVETLLDVGATSPLYSLV